MFTAPVTGVHCIFTYRWCEWSTLDVVALSLHEGNPAGHCEDDKGGDGDQGVLVHLLKDVNALGQLPEGGNSKAKHGQAAVDNLRAQAVVGLHLCREEE